MSVDWDEYRNDFPVIKNCIYLNNAAISPIPKIVYHEVVKFYNESLNYGGKRWNEWEKQIEQTRELFANFINATSPNEIAFTHSTSEGMNIFSHMLSSYGIVILNKLEFPSSNLPWINSNNRGNIRFVRSRNNNEIKICDIAEIIEKTNSTNPKNPVKTIVTSHVQYSTGFKQDLVELSKLSKKYGIFLVINGTQSVGSMDFNVNKSGIDFMCINGHKWMLSSFGIGTIYIKNIYVKQGEIFMPKFFSQSGQKDKNIYTNNTRLSFSSTATRFEIGSPHIPNIIALNASLRYLSQIGISNIEERILKLTDFLIEKLQSINLKILSPIAEKKNRSGIILFQSKTHNPIQLARILEKKYNIIVSARANGIRVSPHFYNNEDDINKLVSVLDRIS